MAKKMSKDKVMTKRSSLKAKRQKNWTAEGVEAFVHKMGFDFIAQLERLIEVRKTSKTKLARQLKVSQSAISHVLNNPQNLTLKTIAKYSQALGAKTAIVQYVDDDPYNEKGLVNSEVFNKCWENAGRPRDFWELEEKHTANTRNCLIYISLTIRVPQVASTYAEPSLVAPLPLELRQPIQYLQIGPTSASSQQIEVGQHA